MERTNGIVSFPVPSGSKLGSPSGTVIGHSYLFSPVWLGVWCKSWVKNCPQARNNPDSFLGSGSNSSSVELQTSLLMSRGEGLFLPLGNSLPSEKAEGAILDRVWFWDPQRGWWKLLKDPSSLRTNEETR